MDFVPYLRLPILISLPNEPLLEKWARLFRFLATYQTVHSILSEKKTAWVLDIGCGQDILYYKFLKIVARDHFRYVGIDPLIIPKKGKGYEIRKATFEESAISQKFDVIVMHAVLEHVDDPKSLLKFAIKHLSPDGKIVVTTPTPGAQKLLEFLAHYIGILSAREIDEHKNYFTKESLQKLAKPLHVQLIHRYFEFGLNNFVEICHSGKGGD